MEAHTYHLRIGFKNWKYYRHKITTSHQYPTKISQQFQLVYESGKELT